MKLNEVTAQLEKTFKIQQAEDFDNVGLLCGNPEREVSGILICHDALEAVVDEAVDKNLNLIVCFHPLIFSGLKSLTGKNYVERAVLKAIEHKIAIYAVHTAFDNDFFGVNHGILEQLGAEKSGVLMPKKNNLKQLVVYVPKDHCDAVKQKIFEAGAGNIGFYDECSFSVSGKGTFRPQPGADPYDGEIGVRENTEEEMLYFIYEDYRQNQIIKAMKAAHPYEEVAYQIYNLDNENQYAGLGMYGEFKHEKSEKEFLNLIKDKFNLKMVRHSELTGKAVKRIGVLGGSGASGIKAALNAGCDAYLTGDVKYHDFFQAESRMLICDIGHFESEQFVTQQLYDILSEKFPKFAISKTEKNTNPIKYFL